MEGEAGAPAVFDEVDDAVDDDDATDPNDEDATANPGEPRYNLRPRGEPRAQFNVAMDEPHDARSYYPPMQLMQYGYTLEAQQQAIFGFVMNQMTAKAGLRKHGRDAEEALMKEFAQLEDLSVYESVDPSTLTAQQKSEALRSLNLIKEKRDGQLKGRTVADGRPQRSLYEKSETALPTVSTDALMLSIMLDARERRDVATADVAGAYLRAKMKDFVLMKFTGEMVDVLCKMNPGHIANVVYENGVKVLYVRLLKAIYGCVKSALLCLGTSFSQDRYKSWGSF